MAERRYWRFVNNSASSDMADTFGEDFPDADSFSLFRQNSGQIYFGLHSISLDVQLNLVVDVTICYADGTKYTKGRWQVENLRRGKSQGVIMSSKHLVNRYEPFWLHSVVIHNVQRRQLGSNKTGSFPIPIERTTTRVDNPSGNSSVGVTRKRSNDHQAVPMPKLVCIKQEVISSSNESDNSHGNDIATTSHMAEHLQNERESGEESLQSEIANLREKNGQLEAKLVSFRRCFERQKIDLDHRLAKEESLQRQLDQSKVELKNLTSELSNLQRLRNINANVIVYLRHQLDEQSAKIDKISDELKLKTESIARLTEESTVKSTSIDKLTEELTIKTDSIATLQTDLAEQLKSHQSEIASLREKNGNLENKLVDIQNCLKQQKIEMDIRLAAEKSLQTELEQSKANLAESKRSQSVAEKLGFTSFSYQIQLQLATTEVQAKLFQLQQNYDRLEAQCNAQATLLELEGKAHQQESANMCERNAALEVERVELQNLLQQQKIDFENRLAELQRELDQSNAKVINQQDQNSIGNRDPKKLKTFFATRFLEEVNVLSSTCSTSTESSQPAVNGQTSAESATDVVIVESESVEPLAVETPSLPSSSPVGKSVGGGKKDVSSTVTTASSAITAPPMAQSIPTASEPITRQTGQSTSAATNVQAATEKPSLKQKRKGK